MSGSETVVQFVFSSLNKSGKRARRIITFNSKFSSDLFCGSSVEREMLFAELVGGIKKRFGEFELNHEEPPTIAELASALVEQQGA